MRREIEHNSLQFLLNLYLILIIVSLIWVGHERILRAIIIIWIYGVFFTTSRSSGNVGRLRSQLALLTLYFIPAIVSSGAALIAKLMGENNEWANGILELWMHPFIPILELIPAQKIWNMSSTFLLACLIPIILIVVNCAVFLSSKIKKKALKAP